MSIWSALKISFFNLSLGSVADYLLSIFMIGFYYEEVKFGFVGGYSGWAPIPIVVAIYLACFPLIKLYAAVGRVKFDTGRMWVIFWCTGLILTTCVAFAIYKCGVLLFGKHTFSALYLLAFFRQLSVWSDEEFWLMANEWPLQTNTAEILGQPRLEAIYWALSAAVNEFSIFAFSDFVWVFVAFLWPAICYRLASTLIVWYYIRKPLPSSSIDD